MADSFVVASIDDDGKRKLKELDEFRKEIRLWKIGLKLFSHPVKKHYFVQLSPAIERWILIESSKVGIRLSDHGLPEGINGLKEMKSIFQRDDARFNKLFRAMLANKKCDEIIELKRWLIFFRDNNYNSNLDLL